MPAVPGRAQRRLQRRRDRRALLQGRAPRRGRVALSGRRKLLSVGGPLVVGAAFYILFRPTEAHFVVWLSSVARPLGAFIAILRLATVPIGSHMPQVVLDVAPDLAWAVALGSLLAIVWRNESRRAALAWFVAGAIGSIGYELGQRWGIVPGTFDPLDLLAQTVGYVGGWALHRPASLRSTSSP